MDLFTIFWVVLGLGVIISLGIEAAPLLSARTKTIPAKYDPHYTRQLEQQEFGYKATKCEDEKCGECYPKPIPRPPSGSAGLSKSLPRCNICKVTLDYDGWCSNDCVEKFREQIKKSFEENLLKNNQVMPTVMASEARYRIIFGKRVRIPDGVPHDAFVKTYYNPQIMMDYLFWKWTDSQTGKTMFLKTPAPFEFDEIEIHSDQKASPIRTVRTYK